MATYFYIAKNADGSERRGTIDARSLDSAREELRKRGLLIEDIREKLAPKPPAPNPSNQPVRPPKPAPLPWSGGSSGPAAKTQTHAEEYAPLHETLRIFAGWLLAWYGLIYALGFLAQTERLPELPFIQELFASRLVLQFTFGTFLLLALSNIHRWLGKGLALGFLLAVGWVALVVGFVWYG